MSLPKKNMFPKASFALSAVAIAVFGVVNPLYVQAAEEEVAVQAAASQSANEATETKEVEKIRVTGSRILRAEFSSPTPMTVLDKVDIETTGLDNVSDILNEIPQVTTDVTASNSHAGTERAGVNTVALRGLGSDRTLTLVDGKRVVSNRTGRQQVDINSLPAGFVERIEVITGGASAVYGSDAIAGVVNIITKSDFEGLEFRARSGISSRSDRKTQNLRLTAGGAFDNDRGNVIFSMEYDDREALYARDRDFSATNLEFNPITEEYEPDYSSASHRGRYRYIKSNGKYTSSGQFTFDDNNQYKKGYSEKNGDYYASNDETMLTVPIQRHMMATKVTYDINDDLTIYMNGSYASVDTYADRKADAGDTLEFSQEDLYPHIPMNNPFIPQEAIAGAPSGALGIRAYKLLSDIPRFTDNTRQTYRAIVGLEGNIDDNWSWDAYYSYGRTVQSQYRSGYFVMHNALASINVTPIDPDNTPTVADGNSVEEVQAAYQCENVLARSQGCLPTNWFGINSMTPESADWISDDTHFRGIVEQESYAIGMNGVLFELPAGDLSIAFGAEHRRDKSETRTDTLISRNQVGSSAIPQNDGEMDVNEFYVEAVVPVLADLPFAQYLGLELAYRSADYSLEQVGSMASHRIGLEYIPFDDLKIRAQSSRAQRAPNLLEAFSALRETSIAEQPDPCDGVSSTGGSNPNATVTARCQADPGLAGFFAANPGQEWKNDPDFEQNGFNGGNPNLREETADTITAGIVYTPSFVEGLGFTFDWYQIDIDDAIVNSSRENTMPVCYGEVGDQPANNDYCKLFFREPSGQVYRIDSLPINADSMKVEGTDTSVNYKLDMDKLGLEGTTRFSLSWTHTIRDETISNLGDKVNSQGNMANPQDRVRFRASYANGPLRFTWRINYTGENPTSNSRYNDALADYAEDQASAEPKYKASYLDKHIAPSAIYHHMNMSYNFGEKENYQVFGGVNNVFDKKPPLITDYTTGVDPSSSSTNYYSGTYDDIGRFFYLGIKAEF